MGEKGILDPWDPINWELPRATMEFFNSVERELFAEEIAAAFPVKPEHLQRNLNRASASVTRHDAHLGAVED